MADQLDRLLEGIDGVCPRCGEEPTGAHERGGSIVLVPCGHLLPSTMMPRVKPPEAYDDCDGKDAH